VSIALDRLVATRVMNWRVHARNTAWWVDADVETGLVPSGGVRGLTSGMDRWSPSTSIKTAWEIVEHLRKAELYMESGGLRVPSWGLLLGAMEYTDPLVSFSASDAAKVICVEALRAVGVPEATIQEACK